MTFVCAAQLRSLHPQQRVNHFPGMNFLTFKDQLVHTCRAASARAVAAGCGRPPALTPHTPSVAQRFSE